MSFFEGARIRDDSSALPLLSLVFNFVLGSNVSYCMYDGDGRALLRCMK